MNHAINLLKWLFPDPKGSRDIKIILCMLLAGGGSYYFSAVYARAKVDSSIEKIKVHVYAQNEKITAAMKSQNELIIQALNNIQISQTEMKESIKEQDKRLWLIRRDTRNMN